MPKLVTENIMNIIKNHVSLNSKNIEIHCQNTFFYGLEGCMCELKRYQTNIKSETKIHPNIDEQSIQISCSKKRYPKHQTQIKQWSKKGVKNKETLEKNNAPKRKKKEELPSQAQGPRVAPGDTIRSKIEKKLTKGKLRDRESVAYPNTPWAPSGPERIYSGPKASPGFPGKAPWGSRTSALHGRYRPLSAPETHFVF